MAAALIGAIGLGGWVYLKGDNGDNTAAQVWVKLAAGTVSKQLPNKAWSITSVKKGDDETIVVEILITDKTHVNQIKSIRRIHRIDFLKTICPVKGPGIIRMTEAGWSLWLNLNSETGKLTGGTCKY